MNVAERVERGIALLDERKPGWRDLVDPNSLDMSDLFDCVLGQVFGTYGGGIKELGLGTYEGSDYGFDVVSTTDNEPGASEDNYDYVELDHEWFTRL